MEILEQVTTITERLNLLGSLGVTFEVAKERIVSLRIQQ